MRQNFASFIRLSHVLWFCLLVILLGGPLEPQAAAQAISFGPKTDFGTGTSPFSVAVADFNGDGRLDLAVSNASDDTVSILLGTGSGAYGAKADFGTGIGPVSVAVGDFNGDGKLDLVTANGSSIPPTVSILLGTGMGTFGTKTDFGTGSAPNSVALTDFNGDGKLDLAVANVYSNTVSILLGTGTGTFGTKSDFGTGTGPGSVAVGDINGDGKLDLATANQSSDTVSILLGTGTGTFGVKTDFGTGSSPRAVALGDFNRDGKLDLAVASAHDNSVSILLGTGIGTFGAKTDFGTGNQPLSVALGDFNGDGNLDLAVANESSTPPTVSILPGTGMGTFGAKTDFGTGGAPFSVAVGDFNRDAKMDVAVANANGNTVSVLLNTTPIVSTGVFCARTDFGTGILPRSVAVGDFNGDGKLDLAVANVGSSVFAGSTVSILLGTSTGAFGPKTDFATAGAASSVALGDFNGDGKLDLAVANQDPSNTVSILLGTGSGTFGTKTDFATGSGPLSVAVGDFNRDGKLDLAVANESSVTVSILLGTGSGTFATKTDFGTGFNPRSVAVGDFNGDGNLDLATANLRSNTVSILLGTGTGTFGVRTDFGTGIDTESVVVGDFNGDGKLDLATANSPGIVSGTVSILLGNGDGTFGVKADFDTGLGPVSVAVGDFNGDGNLDLATANLNPSTVSILLGTGTGSFGTNTDFGTGNTPVSVAAGDFNRDGRSDLVVVNRGGDTLSILLNNCSPPSITASPVTRTAGSPSANSQIATVSDADDATTTLTVTVNGGTGATVNGVTVTLNPTAPNGRGQVFADLIAGCAATTANFTLRVTDSGGSFSEATLTVTVNSPPAAMISPTGQSFTSSGGTGSVNVTNPSGCPWTAVTNDSWINITSGANGTGNGTVNYSVAPNNSLSPRTGTMTIAGQIFSVTQAAVVCTFSISPTSRSHGHGTESDVVAVTAPSVCNWTVVSNDSWITITSGSSGSGNGSVGYTVAPNTGLNQRIGTVTVAGLTFTITQQGTSCVDSLAILFSAVGGTSRLKINAPAGCNWTAMSNDAWITITSATSGTGASALNYSVAANASAIPRNGSLVVAGQRYLVAQEAQACTFSISPGSASFGTSSGTGSLNVTTLIGCNWTAVSNDSWIAITSGASGSASGSINYSVDANLASNPRTGTMTVAGQTFTVNQAGSGIVVVAPNGGETWPKGTTQVIRWTFAPTAGAQVRIELLKGGVLNSTIVAKTAIGTSGIGSFNWLIPTTAPKGSDFQVRITSVTDATFTDTSDGLFTLGNAVALLERIATPNRSVIAEASPPTDTGWDSNFWQVTLRGPALLNDAVSVASKFGYQERDGFQVALNVDTFWQNLSSTDEKGQSGNSTTLIGKWWQPRLASLVRDLGWNSLFQ